VIFITYLSVTRASRAFSATDELVVCVLLLTSYMQGRSRRTWL